MGCAVYQGAEKWEAKVGEAKAVLLGMELGKELRLSRIIVESDCLAVVQALRGGERGRSSFDLVVDDIMSLISCFEDIRFTFVERSGNQLAHSLAHLQPWEFGTRKWFDDFPCNLLVLAEADLSI